MGDRCCRRAERRVFGAIFSCRDDGAATKQRWTAANGDRPEDRELWMPPKMWCSTLYATIDSRSFCMRRSFSHNARSYETRPAAAMAGCISRKFRNRVRGLLRALVFCALVSAVVDHNPLVSSSGLLLPSREALRDLSDGDQRLLTFHRLFCFCSGPRPASLLVVVSGLKQIGGQRSFLRVVGDPLLVLSADLRAVFSWELSGGQSSDGSRQHRSVCEGFSSPAVILDGARSPFLVFPRREVSAS